MSNGTQIEVKRTRGRKKPFTMSEDTIHKAVVQHLKVRARPDCLWFHVPNGGSRNVAEAAKLKAMGTTPGIPDLCLIIGGTTHFLELKTRKGKLSQAQWIAKVRAEKAGAVYAVAHGLDEALLQLSEWGIMLGSKPR